MHPSSFQCIDYIIRNRDRMRYPEFRAQGLCVRTGVVGLLVENFSSVRVTDTIVGENCNTTFPGSGDEVFIDWYMFSGQLGVRTVSRPARRASFPAVPPPISDSVFFFPGKIDIRGVRRLQELARAPGWRAMFARFMVRGHWRRALKNWSDQRIR